MRKFIRHPSDIPIQVLMEDVVSDEKEYLTNISFGGLAFKSLVHLAEGTIVRVKIPLVNPVFETKGRVVWCKKAEDCFDVGIEFLEQKDIFKARMVEQVCYIEHYKREISAVEGRELTAEEAAIEWIMKYAADFPGVAGKDPENPPWRDK